MDIPYIDMLGAGAAMFAFVFLKAFQQRNVAFDAPWYAVMGISYGMVLTEVYIITIIVRLGYDIAVIFAIGTGSGSGALLAMWLHRRIFGKQGSKT